MDQDLNNQQPPASYTEFFSWGSDSHGQLALANSDDDQTSYYKQNEFYEQPKSLSFDILISQISCGDFHAAFISTEQLVFTVGNNSEGQLGVGDSTLKHSSAPLLVDTLPKTQSYPILIKCGGSHTVCLFQHGDLYSWGQSQNGALGNNQQQNSYFPVQMVLKDNPRAKFTDVACGKKHTLAIDNSGDVYATGDNKYKQLGIQGQERVYQLTKLQNFPYRASSVAAGVEHSLILTDKHQIFATGNNNEGNLGQGHTYHCDTLQEVHGLQGLYIKQIAAGRHSGAITEEGNLYIWGPVFKGDKPLLVPQELRSNKLMMQISIGEKISAVIDQDNHIYSWGEINKHSEDSMPNLVESLASKVVTSVSIGFEFVIALGQDFDENGQVLYSKNQTHQKEISHHEGQPQINKYQSYEPKQQISSYGGQDQYSDRYNTQKEVSPIVQQQHLYKPSSTSSYLNEKSPNKLPEQVPSAYIKRADKTDTSMVSSLSSKSGLQQHQHPTSYTQESQAQFQAIPQTRNFEYQNQQQPPVRNDSQSTGLRAVNQNVEMLKQLDILREENHQVKQKQRELVLMNNQLKEENEQLLQHADDEIKRMSEYVDQYTVEVEESKRQIENEYEFKLQQEKQINEDLKLQMHQSQDEIESKLDRLQREIENLRLENQKLKKEKNDQSKREKQLADQLMHTQEKLNMAETQSFQIEKDRNMSPLIGSRAQDGGYSNGGNQSRTPVNQKSQSSHSQQQSSHNSKSRQYYQTSQGSSEHDSSKRPTSQENQYSKVASNNRQSDTRQREPATFNTIDLTRQSHSNMNQSPFSSKRAEDDIQKQRQASQRVTQILSVKSPMRITETNDDQSYAKNYNQTQTGIADSSQQYGRHQQQPQNDDEIYSKYQADKLSSTASYHPLNQVTNESNLYSQKLSSQANEPYYPLDNRDQQYSRGGDVAKDKNGNALNDVKSRLAAMQKNKEDLEEKLKSYEAKIKQHYNK